MPYYIVNWLCWWLPSHPGPSNDSIDPFDNETLNTLPSSYVWNNGTREERRRRPQIPVDIPLWIPFRNLRDSNSDKNNNSGVCSPHAEPTHPLHSAQLRQSRVNGVQVIGRIFLNVQSRGNWIFREADSLLCRQLPFKILIPRTRDRLARLIFQGTLTSYECILECRQGRYLWV